MEMSRLTRDGTAEPVSRGQILRRERGQGNVYFLCSADHEQDWQPCPVDPSSFLLYTSMCVCDHTYAVHVVLTYSVGTRFCETYASSLLYSADHQTVNKKQAMYCTWYQVYIYTGGLV